MSAANVIGALLLLSPFVVAYVVAARVLGHTEALVIYGVVIVIVAVCWLGAALVTS
jgi:hypothetical protein